MTSQLQRLPMDDRHKVTSITGMITSKHPCFNFGNLFTSKMIQSTSNMNAIHRKTITIKLTFETEKMRDNLFVWY